VRYGQRDFVGLLDIDVRQLSSFSESQYLKTTYLLVFFIAAVCVLIYSFNFSLAFAFSVLALALHLFTCKRYLKGFWFMLQGKRKLVWLKPSLFSEVLNLIHCQSLLNYLCKFISFACIRPGGTTFSPLLAALRLILWILAARWVQDVCIFCIFSVWRPHSLACLHMSVWPCF